MTQDREGNIGSFGREKGKFNVKGIEEELFMILMLINKVDLVTY